MRRLRVAWDSGRLALLAVRGTGVVALAVALAGAGGCRANRPAAVPSGAERVAGGSPREGRNYHYTAKADGTVYVVDDWDNSLVYSGPVHAGDVVGINVDGGQITVNGKAVYEHNMGHSDHLVWFAPSGR